MLFSVQRHIEDYIFGRGLSDPDQYAVKVASLYVRLSKETTKDQLVKSIHSIHTAFFAANKSVNRKIFEVNLANRLLRYFEKKKDLEIFTGGLSVEKQRVELLKKRDLDSLLEEFRHTTESRAVDAFWTSRKKGDLIKSPEKIAQMALIQFLSGVLYSGGGLLFQEFKSGIGWVDVGLVLSTALHILELKVLTKKKFTGASQLERYMIAERRNRGWLIVFDARPSSDKIVLPPTIKVTAGTIDVVVIDINPVAPSSLSR